MQLLNLFDLIVDKILPLNRLVVYLVKQVQLILFLKLDIWEKK